MGETNQAETTALPFSGGTIPSGAQPGSPLTPAAGQPAAADAAGRLASACGRGLRLPMAISATVGPLLGDRLALLDERAALGEARPLITSAAARAGRPDPFPADHSPPRTAAVPGSRRAEPDTWQPPAPATGTESESEPGSGPGFGPEVGTEARYQIPDMINRVTRLAREIDDLEQTRARRSTAKGGTR